MVTVYLMVKIEIDGRNIEAKDGSMIIEAADDAGIPIPRFCYHKKLSVAANCRMCLVEVEKAAKPLPACATPITEGMKIFTRSTKAIAAQKGVMEFLLINHPLDCPICDQAGECELQDLAMGFGSSHSQYNEPKRVIRDKDIGPLIATDMTRCIHCTLCVRFGQEIAGVRELGATGRGEHMQIGTYVAKAMTSELSGNIIDLCPVGALTSKPFRYNARGYEMNKRSSVAPHDCVGSSINIESLRGQVRRVIPIENDEINETWISDRDRFSYEGVNSQDRITAPMIKRGGEWLESDWQTALEFAVTGLKTVIERKGVSQLGALASSSSTVEEMYLLQKLVRALGGSNVDFRLQQQDFSDQERMPFYASLGQSITDIESLNAALLIGSNVRLDQPIIGHRLRKAALNGAKLMFVNAIDYEFTFPVYAKSIGIPTTMERTLAAIAKALKELGAAMPEGLDGLLSAVEVTETDRQIANALKSSLKSTVLFGSYAESLPNAACLRALAQAVATMSGSTFGSLTMGANSAGGYLAGAVPHRAVAGKGVSYGLNAQAMFAEKLSGYLLLGIEPEHDVANPAAAIEALNSADFVVTLSPYKSDTMLAYADVIFPVAPFTETSGSYVNIEGRWQSFQGAVKPLGETRPAWKVLRVLGNLFHINGFDYLSSEEVRDELKEMTSDQRLDQGIWGCPIALSEVNSPLVRIAEQATYAIDATLRRAPALQATVHGGAATVRINVATASAQGLGDAVNVEVCQGDAQCVLPLTIDNRVADGGVWLPSGLLGVAGFGANGATIALKPI